MCFAGSERLSHESLEEPGEWLGTLGLHLAFGSVLDGWCRFSSRIILSCLSVVARLVAWRSLFRSSCSMIARFSLVSFAIGVLLWCIVVFVSYVVTLVVVESVVKRIIG